MAELITVPASQRIKHNAPCEHELPCSCVELDGVTYLDIPAAMDALEYRVASHWPGRHAMLEREAILVDAMENVVAKAYRDSWTSIKLRAALEVWKKCRTSQG